MHKPTIFIACGQQTPKEKQLCADIAEIVQETGAFTPCLPEPQTDLKGMQDNIVAALEHAAGFIAVLHPRGAVRLPNADSPPLTRASVWIEQEIAIAALLNRSRKRKLRTAIYCHASVASEGMRTLLHAHPIPFEKNSEILAHLGDHLVTWILDESRDAQGEIFLKATPTHVGQGGRSFKLTPTFRNYGPRANEYRCEMHIPTLLVRDLAWKSLRTSSAPHTIPGDNPEYTVYESTEAATQHEAILNNATIDLMSIEASMAELSYSERAMLINMPVSISAQIGERIYRTQIPIADIFPAMD